MQGSPQFPDAPAHYGQLFAGQTQSWWPSDKLELWHANLEIADRREYCRAHGWLDPEAIQYHINADGFRSAEFDPGQTRIMALGCSYTMGIGLSAADAWPERLAQRLGLPCDNLGWGGYSSDSCYRLARYWIPALKPAYVCMFTPPHTRFELLLDQDLAPGKYFEIFMPSGQRDSRWVPPDNIFLKHWYLHSENALINQEKNSRAVQQLCAELAIPVHVIRNQDLLCRSPAWHGGADRWARDFMHAGADLHRALTDQFAAAWHSLQA